MTKVPHIGVAHATGMRLAIRSHSSNAKRLSTLMSTTNNSSLGVTLGGFGLVAVDNNIREDLDVREAWHGIVKDLSVQLVEDLEDFLGAVSLATSLEKPVGHSCGR